MVPGTPKPAGRAVAPPGRVAKATVEAKGPLGLTDLVGTTAPRGREARAPTPAKGTLRPVGSLLRGREPRFGGAIARRRADPRDGVLAEGPLVEGPLVVAGRALGRVEIQPYLR